MNSPLQFKNLLGAVVVAWTITFVVLFFAFDRWDYRGQFGDMFGSLNVLFSGFAFAALYFTISLQQRQLSKQDEQLELQREELKLQRQEMAASRTELAKQASAQRALTRATIAQIRVAAVHAAVEGHKLKAEYVNRNHALESIDAAADVLQELAEKLEAETTEA